jgi:hypothetical protein
MKPIPYQIKFRSTSEKNRKLREWLVVKFGVRSHWDPAPTCRDSLVANTDDDANFSTKDLLFRIGVVVVTHQSLRLASRWLTKLSFRSIRATSILVDDVHFFCCGHGFDTPVYSMIGPSFCPTILEPASIVTRSCVFSLSDT